MLVRSKESEGYRMLSCVVQAPIDTPGENAVECANSTPLARAKYYFLMVSDQMSRRFPVSEEYLSDKRVKIDAGSGAFEILEN